MNNKEIAKSIKLLAQLMDLHDENSFKVKAFTNAAFRLDKLSEKLSSLDVSQLEKIEGIGKSVAGKIAELNSTGKITDLEKLLSDTPIGIVEMLKIKGIGPKKTRIIWKDLGIENIGELYYACNENRLVEAKGFGLKTQEDIKKVIEFTMGNSGKCLYVVAEPIAHDLLKKLTEKFSQDIFELTGEIRRRCEVLDQIEIICGTENTNIITDFLGKQETLIQQDFSNNLWEGKTDTGISLKIYFSSKKDLIKNLFLTTGNEEHLKQTGLDKLTSDFNTENDIYASVHLPYMEPEMREGLFEVNLAKENKLPRLIELTDLKGTLHNHSTWSDGIHSLEEMASYCKNEMKLEYLGICDHSKTAVYANGLNEQRVIDQQKEIDLLNQKLSPFKIFKGIESDILNDGSLDYSEEILKTFDFVVASVHSNLKMNEEKATARLIKAIENPYTTILGHPTGRLLLARTGYPIDHQKVIDACAANKVVIEINANPLRLDLDWRWIQYALAKNVWLSINPDAHRKEGFMDMYYGTCVARKGGLYKEMCLNAMSLPEIEAYFKSKK
jgi:DNA polymerase (family X)